jgi:hypothetical protein
MRSSGLDRYGSGRRSGRRRIHRAPIGEARIGTGIGLRGGFGPGYVS